MQKSGTIILLNGTSSSGKTTISKELQNILEKPFLHTGIDHFIGNWPAYDLELNDPPPKGFKYITKSNQPTEIKIESVGMQMMLGMYRAIAAFTSAGNNAIIDDMIFDPDVLCLLLNTLKKTKVFVVGVHCSLPVLEKRELLRADRLLGMAKAYYQTIHHGKVYDLEVDSNIHNAKECALKIKCLLKNTKNPRAFTQMLNQKKVN